MELIYRALHRLNGMQCLHGVPGESAGIVERKKIGIIFHSGDQQALHNEMMLLKENQELF